MASTETNAAKRDLMAATIAACRKRGWTTAQLAAWMHVTTSTVNSWGRGASMGTNAQREELAKLEAPGPHRVRVAELVRMLDREVAVSENLLAEDRAFGANGVAASRAARIERIRKRAALLREQFNLT